MEKGKDDDSEQVFPLRISAGIFPQPAETDFQESNPRHSPGKEQFRTFLAPFSMLIPELRDGTISGDVQMSLKGIRTTSVTSEIRGMLLECSFLFVATENSH